MICENCHKSVLRPLELYNGDWACPQCKHVLTATAIEPRVTKENDTAFRMSELCYLRALKTPAAKREQYDRNISDAIEYCKTAARLGNPKALVRLGYYYETGYLTANGGEGARLAYEYYKTVLSHPVPVEGEWQNPDYADRCRKVRRAAAARYLGLIKNTSANMRLGAGYNYAEEKRRLIEAGLYDAKGDEAFAAGYEDRPARIFALLQSCFSQEKAPLFGLVKLDKSVFGQLAGVREATDKKSKLVRYAEKIKIVLFDADNGNLQEIKTEEDCKRVDGARAQYLYFFNENGAHSVSAGKCAAIGRALKKSDGISEYARVGAIQSVLAADPMRQDYIFSEDDIRMYKSKYERWSHATDDLIRSLKKK